MRKIFLNIILLFISAQVYPQTNTFNLKPTLGVTACQIHNDSYSGYNKLGFTAGLMINAEFSKKVSGELGIIFIQKGARKNQDQEKGDYTFYHANLYYTEIPLLIRYKPNKFFLTFGPSLGYLVAYNEANEYGPFVSKPFNKFEYSINTGLGMDLNEKLSFELRANNSFLTIRPWGVATPNIVYTSILSRWFNRGLYSNILELIFSYKIVPKPKSENP